MDTRLNQIKADFKHIVDLKEDNIKTLDILFQKINKLKEIYAEFIQSNKQTIFVFGLDSFHFQGKLIDIEYDDMKRMFYAITNRMYCEYFKLYKLIIEYILETITDKKLLDLIKVNNNYPTYKDLEPFKQYDFAIIQNIHEIIIILLLSIDNYVSNKGNELSAYKMKNNTGLNIDNFVNTFNFNIVVMKEKLLLFITYMEFFHKLHNKYLKRFATKLQLMAGQISNDIKFEDSTQDKQTKRKSLISDITNEKIDDRLLKELKNSITNEVSSPKSHSSDTDDNSTNNENVVMSIFTPVSISNTEMCNKVDEPIPVKMEESVVEPLASVIELEETPENPIIELEEIPGKPEEKPQEETQEEKQEEEQKSDDMSAITENNSVIEEPKKKRVYKPRVKKTN
uniref:Uncharacterized protein n=1 Tax=viral metagenome TaxID=1070528 RepID=A0A6C0HWE9_9ZZZZ